MVLGDVEVGVLAIHGLVESCVDAQLPRIRILCLLGVSLL